MTLDNNFNNSTITMELECTLENSDIKKNISVLSSFTLNQLHVLILDAFKLNSSIDMEHQFKVTPLNQNEKLKNITYLPINSPNDYDGWLTSIVPGVYVEHYHPHAPLDQENMQSSISQVRAEHMWSLGLVITLEKPSLLYIVNSDDDSQQEYKINITLKNLRNLTEEDCYSYYPRGSNQCCKLCSMLQCSQHKEDSDINSYSCNNTNDQVCCEYCLYPNLQGWQGVGTNNEFESRIYELVNQACIYVKQERATFIEANNLKILSNTSSNLRFHCQWVESTGEPCAYCTEDFL
ncbi:hypothetical protein K502DRAFT_350129 [Neoconidiobolus thromboides FSU 785]|nr:hypothetical protein K502DRAFT_350129 [Neoconidiobolus thromboides FSU 785]